MMRHAKSLVSVFCAMCIVLAATYALAAATYHGNPQSKIFHKKECKYYAIKKPVIFHSIREAEMEGFKKCKICFEKDLRKDHSGSSAPFGDTFEQKKPVRGKNASQKIDSVFR